MMLAVMLVVVATVTYLHQGLGDAVEVRGGAEHPADQGPQQLDVAQEHVEHQQLLVVVRRPQEAGQRRGKAVQVLRQDLHKCLAVTAAVVIVAMATIAAALRHLP